MAEKEIQVIQENGSVSKDNIMATYLGDDTNNYTYSSLKTYIDNSINSAVGSLNEEISTFAGAMIFKGTIGTTGATVDSLPASHEVGWTYRVITAGTWAGIKCEVGDMITCITAGTSANNAHWTIYQTNIDGAVTGPATAVNNRIPLFDGTTGKIIKDSGKSFNDILPLRMPINPSQAEIDAMPDGAFYLVY